ncbi:MAG: DUF721 domain-containing protein [Hymenobacteraceae bacterium]|nr:DUF721 domain-containing protein [Hymenobacteraceae bacterium]MDX5397535.1 DUF721 domain-containing protein [Hymenobacteraceae bacterium]MDX5444119.1 DUF721 domain-containing protein [Hymenobacteraceae bacterium]MDX5513613.1 DUF721 domain-containing protein [Hymenobacteraceae bacterium]
MRYVNNKFSGRKADTLTVKEAVAAMLNAYRLNGKMSEVNVVQSWEKIMGRAIALKTTELYFRNGKLFVRISSAPLKHELNMAKSKVVELINRDAGAEVVKEVVFL